MNDKVFGEVEYQDGAWTQTVDISLFGREKEMDIIIQDDEDLELIQLVLQKVIYVLEDLRCYFYFLTMTVIVIVGEYSEDTLR